ncbi:MAG: type II toxin-antitoxin system RelE/ParE family toxin [Acidobacteria bacterium]|nr:type II toxin-antitoxin system RelE/ParE family toxin [Acidobacteriota bacterium]
MARYSPAFRKSVAKDLRTIPKKDVSSVLRRIDRLAEDPRGPGCEKVSDTAHYRVRHADYRVVYGIDDDALVIVVIRVGNRREIYRGI